MDVYKSIYTHIYIIKIQDRSEKSYEKDRKREVFFKTMSEKGYVFPESKIQRQLGSAKPLWKGWMCESPLQPAAGLIASVEGGGSRHSAISAV